MTCDLEPTKLFKYQESDNDPESNYCNQRFFPPSFLIVLGCYFVPSVPEFSIMFSSAADGDFSLSALP